MVRLLTTRQKEYAKNKHILGMTSISSAKAAGYSKKSASIIAYENDRKPSLREYALSQLREKGLTEKVIEVYRAVLEEKPSKPATRQDQIAVGREIAQIEGHYAPKRHEKITLSGTFDAMSMADKLVKLEELKQRLLLESNQESIDT